jgi:hypothetical protein
LFLDAYPLAITSLSIHHPLDLIEGNRVVPLVVEAVARADSWPAIC